MMPSSFFCTRRVGRDDDVVLVLAPLALALGGEHAEHAEGQVLDADDLAHRVLVGEERLGHGLAQQADLVRDQDVAGGEVRRRTASGQLRMAR